MGGGFITILKSPGGGGGYYNITEPWGSYYNITEPLGEGGKFYLTQPKPSHPPFLGNKERTPY